MRKVLIGIIVVVLIIGIYVQEVLCHKPDSFLGRQGLSSGFGRSIIRAYDGLGERLPTLRDLMQERRKEFNKVVFDPISEIPTNVSAVEESGNVGVPGGVRRELLYAYKSRVEDSGRVCMILADVPAEARKQKFLLRLASGKTLMIVHNTEVASHIPDLKLGDEVTFCGEYSIGLNGDMISWTHKDPTGQREAGWLKHNGRIYQ